MSAVQIIIIFRENYVFNVILNAKNAKLLHQIAQYVLSMGLINPISMVVPVSTLQPALQPPTPSHPPMSAKPVTPVVLIVKEIRMTVHHVLEAFLYLTTSAMSTALETTSNLEGCVSCVITNANYAKPPLLIVQLVLKTELMNPTSMEVLV